MKFNIKPLGPELAATFIEYLESTDYAHEPDWATCFCRFYHTNCSSDQWHNRTGETNRLEAIEQIKAGNMKGYLAFDGDKCIGWCNANDIKQYIRIEEDVNHLVKDKKVGCVICFVIHKDYRKQGVARLLLNQAIEDFKVEGFDAVLAIPLDMNIKPEKHYRGTLNMYNELGFREVERDEDERVMWLQFDE